MQVQGRQDKARSCLTPRRGQLQFGLLHLLLQASSLCKGWALEQELLICGCISSSSASHQQRGAGDMPLLPDGQLASSPLTRHRTPSRSSTATFDFCSATTNLKRPLGLARQHPTPSQDPKMAALMLIIVSDAA